MLSTLLGLLVALLVIGLIAWVAGMLLPQPFAKIAQVVCAVLAVIAVIYAVAGMLGSGTSSLAMALL